MAAGAVNVNENENENENICSNHIVYGNSYHEQ